MTYVSKMLIKLIPVDDLENLFDALGIEMSNDPLLKVEENENFCQMQFSEFVHLFQQFLWVFSEFP